jgi:hypothetical protein|mmetsp:Transcript_66010/g.110163  ORF Transcript_66010/g.110163 Transcript_66010/m.110163 type:complete len:101 (+) Transcript_66010:492-794(+)
MPPQVHEEGIISLLKQYCSNPDGSAEEQFIIVTLHFSFKLGPGSRKALMYSAVDLKIVWCIAHSSHRLHQPPQSIHNARRMRKNYQPVKRVVAVTKYNGT